MVSVSYDPEAKALYIQISHQRVAKTIPLGQGNYMDISESGKAIGLEIIFPRSTPQEAIDAIMGVEENKIKLLLNSARRITSSPDS
jgi:uncharacterized protein YuzE